MLVFQQQKFAPVGCLYWWRAAKKWHRILFTVSRTFFSRSRFESQRCIV